MWYMPVPMSTAATARSACGGSRSTRLRRRRNFVVYDIPPGASEGVHTHRSGEEFPGPYDEYYYIMQGHGEMQIDGKVIRVRAGDHLHTPLGVAHGISNTGDGQLRVFLTFIAR
jgi:mannose-6-phosphate isomerase-like protein (cupin superfamily)